jgi:iron complex transport system ATP-binding protein
VITGPTVADVFGLHCEVIDDPVTGGPLVVPVGRQYLAAAATA